jgi:site-specific DNA-methyltransferase (adenine-specific)
VTDVGGLKPYYQDEAVTIYHGDCREVLPLLSSETVHLVLTDPPYGVTYESNRVVGRGTNPISNDGTRLSLRLYRQTIPLLKTQHLLWFTRWDAWPDVWDLIGQSFPLRGLLVWDKGHPGMGDLSHWGCSYELIASAGKGQITGARDSSILRYSPVQPKNRKHPTEKPESLLAYLIEKLDAHLTLDPFMGSGATLTAAKDLGRKAIGIEIEERYCEIAAKRMAQAVLL